MQESRISIKKYETPPESLHVTFNHLASKEDHYELTITNNGFFKFYLLNDPDKTFKILREEKFFKAEKYPTIKVFKELETHKIFLGFLEENPECKTYIFECFKKSIKKIKTLDECLSLNSFEKPNKVVTKYKKKTIPTVSSVLSNAPPKHPDFSASGPKELPVNLDSEKKRSIPDPIENIANEQPAAHLNEDESDKKFKAFKQNLLNTINAEFDTYNNPTGCLSFFKKKSRTFTQDNVEKMKKDWLDCNSPERLLKVFEKQMDYIHKVKDGDDSSLGKRLIKIKKDIMNEYPVHSYIHDQFETYIHPEKNGSFFYYKNSLRSFPDSYIKTITNKLFNLLKADEKLPDLQILKSILSEQISQYKEVTPKGYPRPVGEKSSYVKRLKNINSFINEKINELEENKNNSKVILSTSSVKL